MEQEQEPSTEDLDPPDHRLEALEKLANALPDGSRVVLAGALMGASAAEIAEIRGGGSRWVAYRHLKFLQKLLAHLVSIGWLEAVDRVHPDPRVQALILHLTPARAAAALGCTPRQIRYAAQRVGPDDPTHKLIRGMAGLRLPLRRIKAHDQ